MIQIHAQNINNMPQYATKLKPRSIINELKTKIVGIHLWQEIGVCWSKVDTIDNLRSRTKGLGIHSNITCNTTELPISTPYQSGGTRLVISQTMAPRVIGTGKDTSRL